MVKAYCVKCKEKGMDMKDPIIHQTAKGGYMAKGTCTACGCAMCAMMSKVNADAAIEKGEAKKE